MNKVAIAFALVALSFVGVATVCTVNAMMCGLMVYSYYASVLLILAMVFGGMSFLLGNLKKLKGSKRAS